MHSRFECCRPSISYLCLPLVQTNPAGIWRRMTWDLFYRIVTLNISLYHWEIVQFLNIYLSYSKTSFPKIQLFAFHFSCFASDFPKRYRCSHPSVCLFVCIYICLCICICIYICPWTSARVCACVFGSVRWYSSVVWIPDDPLRHRRSKLCCALYLIVSPVFVVTFSFLWFHLHNLFTSTVLCTGAANLGAGA